MSDEERKFLEEAGYSLQPKQKSWWRRLAMGFWIIVLLTLLVGIGSVLAYRTGFTFSQMQTGSLSQDFIFTDNMATPQPESDRFNILLLGLRGEDDPNGGLLTDSMMVLSIKKNTNQIALISIPRDLYVGMPGQNYNEKINFAYALGYEKKGAAGAMLYSKIAVSQAAGLYLNRSVAINHAAFKEIVDILGGVDVTLEAPFKEDSQFSKEMIIDLPAGKNHLDGLTALYFVRSRFTTSDFDRARRQQLVLVAMKDKAFSLGVLANPIKLYQILESLGRNVKTDLSFNEMKEMLYSVRDFDSQKIIHRVFDTTPEGLLYSSSTPAGAYILLPVGDDFAKIKEACRNIFD